MPNIYYDTLLGATLISGITYKREQDGQILSSGSFRTILDMLQQPDTRIESMGGTGVTTWLTIHSGNAAPLLLKPCTRDSISFTISDDLSSLLLFRIAIACRVEDRDT